MVPAKSELGFGRVLLMAALCGFFAAGCIRGGWVFEPNGDGQDETRYGSIWVTTLTTGASPDIDGYFAEVDEARNSPIAANGEATFSLVPTGYYSVRLVGIDPPCVTGTDQIPLYVFPDSTAAAHFEVDCP
jgi:hypothetical protein